MTRSDVLSIFQMIRDSIMVAIHWSRRWIARWKAQHRKRKQNKAKLLREGPAQLGQPIEDIEEIPIVSTDDPNFVQSDR